LFPYASPSEVFDEHRETTRGRDLDITGISYETLEARGPTQWPCPEGETQGRVRLYEDGHFPTPDGRARFVATPFRGVAENADARYPLRLTTGRLRDQWHAMSRTGSIASLFSHAPEPRLAMHRADLERYGLQDGTLVRVISRRGEQHVLVEESDQVGSGLAFLPMHWGARFLGGTGAMGVNGLTLGALDPHSRQPELKHCAVRVERAALPWRLVAFGNTDFERLGPFMQEFAFASRTRSGTEGVLLRLAAAEAPAPDLLAAIDAVFALDRSDVLRYDDPVRSVGRRIALADGAILGARLSGDTRSERWLHDYWQRGAPVEGVRRYLAMPVATPPGIAPAMGRTICVCHGIDESRIHAAIDRGANTVPALKEQLACGTNCGSCVPELRALISTRRVAA
jgi:assimilatory nitrate reductase catalytic subunit